MDLDILHHFESNCTFTSIYGGKTTSSKGFMWYNLDTNSKRSNYELDGSGFEFLEVYSAFTPQSGEACWIYYTKPKSGCSVERTWGPITVDMFGWLQDGAEYQGQFLIDGQKTSMYNYSSGAILSTIYIDSKNYPVRLINEAFTGDADIWDFLNFKPNVIPNQNVFAIPDFCK